jgi:hypothetical protein
VAEIHPEKSLRRLRFGSTRIVLLPEARIDTQFFKPRNQETIKRIGRAHIVESRINEPQSTWYRKTTLVYRGYEKPARRLEREGLHRLDPVGEARILLEIRKRLKGSKITAANPVALVYPKGGRPVLVHEFVPGDILQQWDREFQEWEVDEHGLETVRRALQKKGILPLDLHGRNVLRTPEGQLVVVDAKHFRLRPSDPLARKLERHRIIRFEGRSYSFTQAVSLLREHLNRLKTRFREVRRVADGKGLVAFQAQHVSPTLLSKLRPGAFPARARMRIVRLNELADKTAVLWKAVGPYSGIKGRI